MKQRIYLFCNDKYGSAYLEVFRLFALKPHNFACYVVFSPKGKSINFHHRIIKIIISNIKNIFMPLRWMNESQNGLTILEVEDVNNVEFIESIPMGSIGFVAGFNQLFRKSAINKFSYFINFHPSLLPYYRGAIPSYWAIKNNEKNTGFTAHVIIEKIDAGEIIYQEQVEINGDISEEELDCKIAAAGSYYFNECLKSIKTGKPFRRSRVGVQYTNKIDYVSAVRE